MGDPTFESKYFSSTIFQVMRSYKDVVAESNDLETITDRTEPVSDKTEPVESSVWDSVSDNEQVSIGADVKTKARKFYQIFRFKF